MAKEDLSLNVEEMAAAGLHFGHRTSKLHPKMLPYIYGARNSIHIIDLEATKEKLKEALEFVRKLISENKILLIVGSSFQAKSLVKNFAESLNLPYINERWLGGTFTNFEIIKKRCEVLKQLEEKLKNPEIAEKYTKKERKKMEDKLEKLEMKFGGLKKLEKLPDAIFVLDMKKDKLAISEARKKGIKIIAISDTNCDPTLADFPIPASDDAVLAVKYILKKVKEVILSSK